MRSFLLLAVLTIFAATTATADKYRVFADNSPLTPVEYKDPFVWDDIILRGTVIRIESETLPAVDWFTPRIEYASKRPVDILTKFVRVHEMLRGCISDSVVVLRNLDGGDEEETQRWISRITGRGVILTARHKESPQPTWVLFSSYLRAGDGWAESWDETPDTLSEAEIRESVATLSVSRMTADSDLVIRGTILSHRDVGVPGQSYPEYVVQPTVVLKGAAANNVIVKAAGGIDLKDGSQWRTLLGTDLDVATTWYLFLAKREDGTFQPNGAWRSTFKVDGNRLLERTNNPSCYTPSSLETEIRAALSQ